VHSAKLGPWPGRPSPGRPLALSTPAALSQDVGDVAVIEDDGTIVIEPFRNEFDLDHRRLHFTPNSNGGYDITSVPFAFETDLGTDLHAGDDTNHEIPFTGGFTFPFFGKTWTTVWIRSNANVTFGGIGNPNFYDPNDFFLELPMIAAFFADLNPAVSGQVLYKQFADRFLITWYRITEFDNNNSNTIQLTLFPDGSFDFAYNGVAIRIPINELPLIVGYNSGKPNASSETVDFSNVPITGSSAGILFEAFQEVRQRQVDILRLAQKFYVTHPDSFDQLLLLSNFDYIPLPVIARFTFVRNDVRGIGFDNIVAPELFDFSAFFGSRGRLQGFLEMNRLSLWPEDPSQRTSFGLSFLTTEGQEAAHRWLAFVYFDDNGIPSDLLLGRSLAHWSFFHDTDASVMEGNDWRDNGDGSFTSVWIDDNYSMLDEYLMGLRAPEEVAPFFFIANPDQSFNCFGRPGDCNPQLNVTVRGTQRWVTLNQVIQAEGPRIPPRDGAPKDFRQAYILLTLRGVAPTPQEIAKVERFRQAWEVWFAGRTDGRGTMQTQLHAERPVAAVEGAVVDSRDGSILKNFQARLLEKNYRQFVPDGGYYAFRILADSVDAPPLQATIVIDAFPFMPDTSQVTLTFGRTELNPRALKPLPTSALRGTVRGEDGKPARAKVTLFGSSTSIPPFQFTDSTDVQGHFAFENLYVSSGSMLKYDSLRIEPDIPYVAVTIRPVTVKASAPTVVDTTLAIADVLLVNDDPGGAFANYYTSALDSLGLKAYVWTQRDRGVAKTSALALFKKNLLIWYTGNTTGQTLSPAERDSLVAYLDHGGRLFLTGQNIAEGLQGTAFLRDRLHVSFVRNINDALCHGVQTDVIGRGLKNIATAGARGANNQTSRDLLQPDSVASVSIVYDTTQGTVAGVRVEDPANHSKLVFFGFGFEAVNPGQFPRPGFVGRVEVMRNVVAYLTGTAVYVQQGGSSSPSTPRTYRLSQNYPNPFNAETVISYQWSVVSDQSAEKRVTLKIYDVLGREVRTLVDELQVPGEYRVTWDGRNNRGEAVASGVYFYQLKAGDFSQVRKMAYVR